jgi:pimeloyl-ACP methyl ester carboxylesterase
MHASTISTTIVGALGLFAGTAAAGCAPVSITTTVTAENVLLGNLPDPSNATDVKSYFDATLMQGPTIIGTSSVAGTYHISGRYCSPPEGVNPLGTVQLLVHGITYTKELWSGFGLSPQYDYESFATARGYHTLSIDRLGHGESDKPDPFAVTQGPTHVAILHDIIQQVRAGTVPGVAPPQKLAVVGHSYGSAMANHLALAHPSGVDAYVLTGFSDVPPESLPVSALLDAIPAATQGSRFQGVPLGYFAFATESFRNQVFYDGPFDPTVAAYDFSVQDTVSAGELFSTGLERVVTPYAGPVLMITGDADFFFCPGEGPESCEAVMKSGARLYPQGDFEYVVLKGAGHLLMTQGGAQEFFERVHEWLGGKLLA